MSKYLTKIKKGTSDRGINKMNIKFNFTTMDCGNNYKEGLSHKFESDDSTDVLLLINIIRRFRLGVKISEIKPKSFIFESPNENIQIFFFRICRYTRLDNIKKILYDTIEINKSGVKIQNAFLLAHYYNYNNQGKINYYNSSMDGFCDLSSFPQYYYLNKPFKYLKDLKLFLMSNNPIIYNNIYFSEQKSKQDGETVMLLLKNNDFKAAENYLLYIFK